jgi:iron(III) transport system permease protein
MLLQMDGESVKAVFGAEDFLTIVGNSLSVSLAATLITVLSAYALAVATQRCGIKGQGIFALIFTLPMLVPSISNGMGLIILFGNNGIITRLLGLTQNIYGFWGIVLGSWLYAFPVAYLMFADVLRYEDRTPYEAAKVLGMSKWRQFTAITWPYIRRPLVSVVFSVFTLIVTDYGVPLMVGGKFKTIPVVNTTSL